MLLTRSQMSRVQPDREHHPALSARLSSTGERVVPLHPPPRLRRQRVNRYWRYRLAPDPLRRAPKGALPFWTRVRRLLWSWWPWAIACVLALVLDKWGWAIGTGLMALVSYLLTPVESAAALRPRSRVRVDDEEFLADDGRRDRRSVPGTGQPHRHPQQRRRVLPGDARRDRPARRASITIEAYIYWAGEIGMVFAQALARRRSAGVAREDPARRGRLGDASATRS